MLGFFFCRGEVTWPIPSENYAHNISFEKLIKQICEKKEEQQIQFPVVDFETNIRRYVRIYSAYTHHSLFKPI